MALEDVDWISLAADKHRWLDVLKNLVFSQNAGRTCQLVEKDC
jgi:hypothetical protein